MENINACYCLGINQYTKMKVYHNTQVIVDLTQNLEYMMYQKKLDLVLTLTFLCLLQGPFGHSHCGQVRFDLWPLLQGQTRTAKLKSAYYLPIIGP